MVALQILVLPVGVRILLGERKTPNTHRVRFFSVSGPFVYRLGRKILNL